MDFLYSIWALIPGADDAAKLRSAAALVGIAGGVALIWGLVRWLRKEDLGTTTKTILKTQKSADERAAEERRELRELVLQLSVRVDARLTSLPAIAGAEMRGEGAEALMKDLSAAIQRLAADGKEAALASLAAGDERAAMTALAEMRAEIRKNRAAAAGEEAALVREQGALAFLNDTAAAMQHYAEACELDPSQADSWNRLGFLNSRDGDLDAAKSCYEHVMAMGHAAASTQVAAATGNLGNIYKRQGDMDAACENWRKALELFRQVGMQPQIEQVEGWMRDAGCLK